MENKIIISESTFKKAAKRLKKEFENIYDNPSLTESKEILSRVLRNTSYHEVNKIFNKEENKDNNKSKKRVTEVEKTCYDLFNKMAYNDSNIMAISVTDSIPSIDFKQLDLTEFELNKNTVSNGKNVSYLKNNLTLDYKYINDNNIDVQAIFYFLCHVLSVGGSCYLRLDTEQHYTISLEPSKVEHIEALTEPSYLESDYSPFEKREPSYLMYIDTKVNYHKNSYTMYISNFKNLRDMNV